MATHLPFLLRQWVTGQAVKMGLPGPDNYLLLLVRLDWQRHQLGMGESLTTRRAPSLRGSVETESRPHRWYDFALEAEADSPAR